jgi:hypothetical protein
MKVTKLLGYLVSPCYTTSLKNMWLLQNLMLEESTNKEVVVDEEEIFTQALGGKHSGHVRGMGKFVIPTPSSSSRSLYGTQLNLELEETNRKIEELQNELVEKK